MLTDLTPLVLDAVINLGTKMINDPLTYVVVRWDFPHPDRLHWLSAVSIELALSRLFGQVTGRAAQQTIQLERRFNHFG